MLLLGPGRVVSTDRLAELLWDGEPPERARRILHSHVSRLRAALANGGGAEIESISDGYRIHVDPQTVDAHQFQALVDQAATTTDLATRAEWLRTALDLWRGPPLDNAASGWLRDRLCTTLVEQHLTATESWLSTCLELGRVRDVLPELARQAGAHPGRESLVELHIRALYQAGRKVEALEVYERARSYLADELGLDPSPKLRQLHQAVLRDQLAPPVPANTRPVPRQLPADVAGFTGRDTQLHELDAFVADEVADEEDTAAVVISAIGGTAGVGKTALAVRWAHRVADRFPDGQLYVNLRGYDPDQPRLPGDALAGFLSALGVPDQDLPLELDDRAARFRSEIAGRRMLVVLDNAGSVEQVRPLLPGGRSCAVVVTSRDRLAGLVALHGAQRLDLDLLPKADAIALLRRLIGPRVDAEPDAAAALADTCARLPLALRVAANQAAARPDTSLTALVHELDDHHRRLDLLDLGDDPHATVRIVFSWSVKHLPSDAARTFRLLGLHPGPDFDPYAVAALAGSGVEDATRALELLARVHLVHATHPGRYGMHDLLHAYAAHLADTADEDRQLRKAQDRLFDHYLQTASAAMSISYPYDRGRRPGVGRARTRGPEFSDSTQAIAWLDAELANLLAAAQRAGDGWPDYACQLPAILHRHLSVRGRYRDAEALHHNALTIARSTRNRDAEVNLLTSLGDVHRVLGQPDQAVDDYQRALTLAQDSGHRAGELHAHIGLGNVHRLQSRPDHALGHHRRALAVATDINHLPGQLDALLGLGDVHWTLGQLDQVLDCYTRALAVAREVGHYSGELDALAGIGNIHRLRGGYEEAASHYEQALTIARGHGHRSGELGALTGLGNIHQTQGRYARAELCYRQALEISSLTCHRVGEASSLTRLGDIHRLQGNHDQAADHYHRALAQARQIANRNWQFEALQGMGRLQHAAGRHRAALTHHHEALQLARDVAVPIDQARAHDGLAAAYQALTQYERARQHWQRALEILTSLGTDHTDDPETNVHTVRDRLAAGEARHAASCRPSA